MILAAELLGEVKPVPIRGARRIRFEELNVDPDFFRCGHARAGNTAQYGDGNSDKCIICKREAGQRWAERQRKGR